MKGINRLRKGLPELTETRFNLLKGSLHSSRGLVHKGGINFLFQWLNSPWLFRMEKRLGPLFLSLVVPPTVLTMPRVLSAIPAVEEKKRKVGKIGPALIARNVAITFRSRTLSIDFRSSTSASAAFPFSSASVKRISALSSAVFVSRNTAVFFISAGVNTYNAQEVNPAIVGWTEQAIPYLGF